ncbi:MAG TPA: DUF2887 domain-containing protein, partial [Caldilineaceae bacterium]|nr:DUF2887 domain-containing protein [Caldilineaceae bacterium]
MRTDRLFHEYFHLAPEAFFALFQIHPACRYRCTSPVLKESERRIDSFFEPETPGEPYYFLEVQGYRDPSIYWRCLHEAVLYHARQPELNGRHWQAYILFLDAADDPGVATLGPLANHASAWLHTGVVGELL